tara:strand:+ start:423 stop:872 length:450 start_codon:yes stop_codon:yes gene_type:complete
MELLWFVLTGYGLTQLLVYGSIFKKQREFIKSKSEFLGELVHCPMCTGFWVGSFLLCINPFTELFNFDVNLVNFLICGWLGSGTSYIMNMVFSDKGMNFFHNHNDPPMPQQGDGKGCQNCGPYNQVNLNEMGYYVPEDHNYYNGGKGDE